MKLVKQEDDFGCGAACVASILKRSYQDTLDLFENGKNRARIEGFYCGEIVTVLNSNNLVYEFKYIKPSIQRRIHKAGTIVFIKRSKKYPFGHYLLRTEKGWMDPWINFPQKKIKAGFRTKIPGKPIYAILNPDYIIKQ